MRLRQVLGAPTVEIEIEIALQNRLRRQTACDTIENFKHCGYDGRKCLSEKH